MSLVTLTLTNPTTLSFIVTRGQLHSYEEVFQGYQQYMALIARVRATGQKLHVILDLTRVRSLDLKLWGYVKKIKAHLDATPTLPTIVTKLTIKVPFAPLKPVLHAILPFCVGPATTVVIE